MEKLKQLAMGMNHRFPEGNDAFQITTRLLEECGEVAKEVNRLEKKRNEGTASRKRNQGRFGERNKRCPERPDAIGNLL